MGKIVDLLNEVVELGFEREYALVNINKEIGNVNRLEDEIDELLYDDILYNFEEEKDEIDRALYNDVLNDFKQEFFEREYALESSNDSNADQVKTNSIEKNIEKSVNVFADISLNIYGNYGNFDCTMAYMKEYAKQNGMSLSNRILNTSNLKETLDTKNVEAIKNIFSQAAFIGDREYLVNVLKEGGFKPTNTLIDTIKNVNQHFGKDHSVRDLKELSKNLKSLSDVDRNVVKDAVNVFQKEESILSKFRSMLPIQ